MGVDDWEELQAFKEELVNTPRIVFGGTGIYILVPEGVEQYEIYSRLNLEGEDDKIYCDEDLSPQNR